MYEDNKNRSSGGFPPDEMLKSGKKDEKIPMKPVKIE
jgi:hypothetical protein